MRVRVLGAFRAAGFADVRANLADVAGKFAAASHVTRGEPANRGAVDVEPDAFRHHFDVLLTKTGGCTVVARVCAAVTGLDARLMLLVSHD